MMDMLKGINEALNYIEDNLDNHIDLREVAKRAYCSEYHFKRLFTLLSGMTISDYIRRRRLTMAALELKDPHVKVIDTALKYGYHSPDAFSRSFQNFHGITPTSARNSGEQLKAYPRLFFQLTIQGGVEMKYRIVEKGPFRVVGAKFSVVMVNEELSPGYGEMIEAISDKTMEELTSMSDGDELRGIVHVSANYSEDAEGKGIFDQYIGAVTTKKEIGEYSVLEVPSFLWAVFEVEGEWQEIETQWQRIYTEWLPASSYELAEGPEILADNEHKSEIWVPVKKKD